MRVVSTLAVLLLGAAALASGARGQTLPAGFYLEDAADATFVQPVAMAFAPGGRIFVVEKAGTVWVVQNGELQAEPFIDLRAEVLGQHDRGLLGIAVDPDFATTRRVYLSYTVDHEETADRQRQDAYARVIRVDGQADNPNEADLSTKQVLIGETFATGIPSCYYSHTIGSLAVGSDGSLLVGAGDGAHYQRVDDGGEYPVCFGPGKLDASEDIGAYRSQRLESLAGKILRIDPETGRGYASNPFYTGDPDDTASKVWALGVRNPYRFTLIPDGSTSPASGDPGTLYIGDVGWARWEELNVVRGGENLGWPCYEGDGLQERYPQDGNPATNGCDGPLAGTLTGPVYTWHHNTASLSRPSGRRGHAVVMGAPVQSSRYPGFWSDALYYGDYADGWMAAARLDASGVPTQERLFSSNSGPIVAMTFDSLSRYLYLVDIGRGRIRRLRHTDEAANASPVAQARATPEQGGVGVRVQFSPEGSFDPDDDALTYVWTFSDGTQSDLRAPIKQFDVPGDYTAELAVTDGINVARKTVPVRVEAGGAPRIEIVSPTLDTRPGVGESVHLRASVSDPDQAAGSLFVMWEVMQVHEAHIHPDVFVGSGTETTFTPEDHGIGGELVYYRVRATVRDASGLESSAERALFLDGSVGETDVTSGATPIALIPTSTGGGRSLAVIADGVFPARGSVNYAGQYDSFTGPQGGRTQDWVGLEFDQERRFSRLTFHEGMHGADGGWWETLGIQVREDGLWRDVLGLEVHPAYRAHDAVSFDTYELAFLPAMGDAVRLIGRPGGSASFISVGELRAWVVDGDGPGAVPAPWASGDVGAPVAPGSASAAGGAFSVRGGGEIWGQRDAFHFVHQPLAADGVLTAQVTSLSSEPDWAKAGLLIRESLAPEAPYVGVVVSNLGVHLQGRTASGGVSDGPVDLWGRRAPVWLRLEREGTTVTASVSNDGVAWSEIGALDVPGLTDAAVAGLAVSAADDGSGRRAQATFRDVTLAARLPAPWASGDVGTPAFLGSASAAGDAFSVRGGGEIWGQRDAFHFVHQPLAGDGSIVARLASRTGGQDWAKAGVMVRADLSPEAANAALVMSALGLHLQYRADAGQSSAGPLDYWGEAAPAWIRLDRTGSTVAAFRSDDGSTWEASGTVSVPGLGTGPVLVGLAVSAADNGSGREASGAFESVAVGTAETLLPSNLAAKPVGFGIDSVFPNPARGRVTVRATLPTDGPVVLDVLDVLGRRLASARIEAVAGVRDLGLDLGASPPGAYVVRLRDDASGETVTHRLTVVR